MDTVLANWRYGLIFRIDCNSLKDQRFAGPIFYPRFHGEEF